MDHKTRKNKKSYTILDIYRYFTQEIGVEVPYFRFKRILDHFNKLILEEIEDRSKAFKMPLGLGFVCIVKYKPKSYSSNSLSKDYKSSKEEGKTIYHLNEHSNGYKFRLYWSKIPKTFPQKYKYQLSLVRTNKRRLAQLIFNRQDYIDCNDLQIYQM